MHFIDVKTVGRSRETFTLLIEIVATAKETFELSSQTHVMLRKLTYHKRHRLCYVLLS